MGKQSLPAFPDSKQALVKLFETDAKVFGEKLEERYKTYRSRNQLASKLDQIFDFGLLKSQTASYLKVYQKRSSIPEIRNQLAELQAL